MVLADYMIVNIFLVGARFWYVTLYLVHVSKYGNVEFFARTNCGLAGAKTGPLDC